MSFLSLIHSIHLFIPLLALLCIWSLLASLLDCSWTWWCHIGNFCFGKKFSFSCICVLLRYKYKSLPSLPKTLSESLALAAQVSFFTQIPSLRADKLSSVSKQNFSSYEELIKKCQLRKEEYLWWRTVSQTATSLRLISKMLLHA